MPGKNNDLSDGASKQTNTKQTSGRQIKSGQVSNSTTGNASQPEKDFAQKALLEFNRGNYSQALVILNKLENCRPKDVKVLHNKAVCEFYISGLKNTEDLRKCITAIIEQSTNGSGHGRVPKWPGSSESSVAVVNLAVLSFHQQQFIQAIELLMPLYVALESLEESVGTNLCLLLAASYLRCGRPDNALSVVSHTEAVFLPQNLAPSPSSPEHTPTPPQLSSGVSSVATSCPSTAAAAAAAASAGGSSSENEVLSSGHDWLRKRLQLLRVRCFIALRFLKPGVRVFKAALQQAASAGTELEVSQICIKSQLKFLRGRHLKALKVLNTCTALPATILQSAATSANADVPSVVTWYYNNLALIHAGLNKPALALLYLEKAAQHLQQEGDDSEGSEGVTPRVSARLSVALTYNLGCLLLRLNSSPAIIRRAFDAFLEVRLHYPASPRVWLHLAQCCIALHNWDLQKSQDENCGVRVLGTGVSAKLLLQPYPDVRDDSIYATVSDSAFPEPCLPFARLCLLNAQQLLPAEGAHADEQEGDGPPEVYPAPPSLPMRGLDAERVRWSVLACSAYTLLCLRQYQPALASATALLAALPQHSDCTTYRFLGHMYASECCIMLNKMNDAINYLDLSEIREAAAMAASAEKDPSEPSMFDVAGSIPQSQRSQCTSLTFNLCVVYALRQDYSKAATLLSDIWDSEGSPKPPLIVMLAVYLQLRQGHLENARKLVTENLKYL